MERIIKVYLNMVREIMYKREPQVGRTVWICTIHLQGTSV